jgi:hypothetical protein
MVPPEISETHRKKTESPYRTGQVERTVQSMVRFYVDNIDEKSDLGDICIKIYNEHKRVIRDQQENEST